MSADDMPAVSRRRFLNACRRAGSRICRRAHRSLLPAGCDNGGADRGRPASRPAANSPTRSWKPFKTRRLVGLGEAHGLQNYHDVLGMLLSDPRVPEVVDDIVVEFGNALYQPMMDRFISGQPVGNADLRPTWRDTTQSPAGTWDQPSTSNSSGRCGPPAGRCPPAGRSGCWATLPSTGPRSQTLASFASSGCEEEPRRNYRHPAWAIVGRCRSGGHAPHWPASAAVGKDRRGCAPKAPAPNIRFWLAIVVTASNIWPRRTAATSAAAPVVGYGLRPSAGRGLGCPISCIGAGGSASSRLG